MLVDMASEAGWITEGSVAVFSRALEWQLPRVDPGVDAEIVGLVEAMATVLALVWTLLRVRALMNTKIGRVPELFLAGLAP